MKILPFCVSCVYANVILWISLPKIINRRSLHYITSDNELLFEDITLTCGSVISLSDKL